MNWLGKVTLAAALVCCAPWSLHAQMSSTEKPEEKSTLSDLARTPGVPKWGTGPGFPGSPDPSIGKGGYETPAYEKHLGYGGSTTDLRRDSISSGLGSTSGAGGGSTGTGVGRQDIR